MNQAAWVTEIHVLHDHDEPGLNTVWEATWGGAGRPDKGHAHLTKPAYNKPSNEQKCLLEQHVLRTCISYHLHHEQMQEK
jgi:hypothetical protein